MLIQDTKSRSVELISNPYICETALDLIVALKIKDNIDIIPENIVQNLAVLTSFKIKSEKDVVEIERAEEVLKYTNNKDAYLALKNGLDKIFLVNYSSENLTEALNTVSKRAFTLIIDPLLEISRFPSLPENDYSKKYFIMNPLPVDINKNPSNKTELILEYQKVNGNYTVYKNKITGKTVFDIWYNYSLEIQNNPDLNQYLTFSVVKLNDGYHLCLWVNKTKDNELKFLNIYTGQDLDFKAKMNIAGTSPTERDYLGEIIAGNPVNNELFTKNIAALKEKKVKDIDFNVNIEDIAAKKVVKTIKITLNVTDIDTVAKFNTTLNNELKKHNYTSTIINNITAKVSMLKPDSTLSGVFKLNITFDRFTDDCLFLINTQNPKQKEFYGGIIDKDIIYTYSNYETIEEEIEKIIFNGVIVKTFDKIEKTEAQKGVVRILSPLNEGFAGYLFSNFLSQPIWNSLQYFSVSNLSFTPIVRDNEQAKEARRYHYTFLFYDKITVKTPSLFYFRVGNEAITSIYLENEIKQQIQVKVANFIKSQHPTYINKNLGLLEYYGNEALKTYKDLELIGNESKVTVKPLAFQKINDIIAGKVTGFNVFIQKLAVIWWTEGEQGSGY